MNSEDPLNQLPPLAMPDAISWWPPAPGWWLLLALLVCAVVVLLLLAWRHWQAGRIKRLCLRELDVMYQDYQAAAVPDSYQYLLRASQLLRRFCIQQWHRPELASLAGQPWLHTLDTQLEENCLSQGAGKQLLKLYQQDVDNSNADIAALHNALNSWFKKAPNKFCTVQIDKLNATTISARHPNK